MNEGFEVKWERGGRVYVSALRFVKLIVVEGGWCTAVREEGAVWSWHGSADQSSERRGPRTEAEQAVRNVHNVHMWRAEPESARNWMKCARPDEREKWRRHMELKIPGIVRAGCFLLRGLPEEYSSEWDWPAVE